MVVDVRDFDGEVKASSIPVVVDFWAEWCGPCKMLGPAFEKLENEFKDRLKFAKVNVDEHPDLAESVGVLNIPCLVLFRNGEEAGRVVGAFPEPVLRQKLAAWI